MSAERNDWPRIRELFEAALLLPTEARTEFLTKACADDLALRERVQRLLDSHEHAGVFLEGDIVPASPGKSGLDLAGKKVGCTKCWRGWVPAVWAKCIGRAMHGCIGMSR